MVGHRQFRYAAASNGALAKNLKHLLPLQHTLKIYRPNAAYTFIPKNACSTMRLSVAIANGCIKDASQSDWIHANNHTFSVTNEEAYLASYTFVILRCPYRRLASAFLDKFVDMDIQSWDLYNRTNRLVHPHDLTFVQFLRLLKVYGLTDYHWRRQVDFLLYEDYDDYFCVEDFAAAERVLKTKIDFDVVDARDSAGSNLSALQKAKRGSGYAQTPAAGLLEMKRKGVIPDARDMYDDEAVELVSTIYDDDVKLYARTFGAGGLLFGS